MDNLTSMYLYCLTKLNVFDLHLARYKIMRGPSLLPGGGGGGSQRDNWVFDDGVVLMNLEFSKGGGHSNPILPDLDPRMVASLYKSNIDYNKTVCTSFHCDPGHFGIKKI